MDNQLKYCGSCGNQVDVRAEICPKCGIRVSQEGGAGGGATIFCQHCGNQMDVRAEICPKCGIRVAQAQPQPQYQPQPQPQYQAQPQYQPQPQYPPQYPPQYQPPVSQKSEGLAAVLSFIIPGLGQIYNGEMGKGILFLILSFVFWGLMFVLIGFILYPILWLYGIYDAYTTAKKINQRNMYPGQQPYQRGY